VSDQLKPELRAGPHLLIGLTLRQTLSKWSIDLQAAVTNPLRVAADTFFPCDGPAAAFWDRQLELRATVASLV
jgi:hypothetical protein